MEAFKRSRAYRLWVLLGLPALFASVTVVALRADPAAGIPVPILVLPLVWIAGVLALGWRQVRVDRRNTGDVSGVPADLRAALSLDGAAPVDDDAMYRFTRYGFVLTVGFAAACVTSGMLLTLTTLPFGLAVAPAALLIVYGCAQLPAQLKRGYELGNQWLEPLGLVQTGFPTLGFTPEAGGDGINPRLQGASVYDGYRHGRFVHAEVWATGSSVQVRVPTDRFSVLADAGRLAPVDGTVAWAAQAAVTAQRSDAWRRVRVIGDGEAIVVERRGGGTTGWLTDLWLAEHFADAGRTTVTA